MAGLSEAQGEGERAGVRVIGGCEFSVRAPWGEMHLLGYLLPLGHPEIEEFLRGEREMRLARARRMVEHLQAWGVTITAEDVLAEAGGAAVGRPHVARALVRLGKVPDVAAAFNEFLGQGRRGYVEKVLPEFSAVAALVHGAGGLVSAAHLRDRATRTTLQLLRNSGLDAVEVRHPRHSPDQSKAIAAAADAVGLLRTGGTDWHGDEPDGTAIGAWAVPLAWLERLETEADRRKRPTPGARDGNAAQPAGVVRPGSE